MVSSVDVEPAITIRGIFIFYGKMYWWYLNFFVMPIVVILDVLIFTINLFKTQKLYYIRGVFINYTIAALRSLHRGEIPLLKFLTLRYFTRLFVSYHIRKRVRVISTFLRGKELRSLFAVEEDPEGLKKTKDSIDRLSKLDKILSKSVELKLFLSVASYWGIVTAGLKVFGVEAKGESVRSFLNSTLSSNQASAVFLIVFFLVSTLLLTGFFALISSFVRKRELADDRNIYEFERVFFGTEQIPRPREFPFDIVGWGVCLVLFSLPFFLEPTQDGYFLNAAIVFLPPLACLFYALYRRLRSDNY